MTREEVERCHIRFVELYKLVLKFKKLGRAEIQGINNGSLIN